MRNTESHFSVNPTNIDISRSRFDRDASIKFSGDVGRLIPFYVDEVLPGDTFQIRTSKVIRMFPMATPPMDDLYMDTYYFFVPNRLVWEHWQNFQGENTESAWIPETEYSVPQLYSPTGGWQTGTIADYMGIVPGKKLYVNALPFRAYALICDQWFRDQNLMDPLVIPKNDSLVVGSNGDDQLSDIAKGGMPFQVSKYHDYFTSALPSPQKGPDITIPTGNLGQWPVIAEGIHNEQRFMTKEGYPTSLIPMIMQTSRKTGEFDMQAVIRTDEDNQTYLINENHQSPSRDWPYDRDPGAPDTDWNMAPNNLWAIPDPNASFGTINQLRIAFQIQKAYERDARGGTRYVEILKSHFGVTSPDARLQRPEYLGGNRVPLNVNQVIQQSDASGEDGSPLATVAGLPITHDTNGDFTHSFVEHGFVIGVCCVRYRHTYTQGLERFWRRKNRFDYYMPVFANLGEQGIKNCEIYASDDDVRDAEGLLVNDRIFGYQEAWADYRYKPSRCAGVMRPYAVSPAGRSLTQIGSYWTFADKYDSLPTLSASWIREDPNNVARVSTVGLSLNHQFWVDCFVQNRTTRPMPLYSIPGMLDHH